MWWRILVMTVLSGCGLIGRTVLPVESVIYEDQAFKFDWLHNGVGVPLHVRASSTSGGGNDDDDEVPSAAVAAAVFVASRSGAVASLDSKTGAINWRHLLSTPDVLSFGVWWAPDLKAEVVSATVSASPTSNSEVLLYTWKASDGALVSERAVMLSSKPDVSFVLGGSKNSRRPGDDGTEAPSAAYFVSRTENGLKFQVLSLLLEREDQDDSFEVTVPNLEVVGENGGNRRLMCAAEPSGQVFACVSGTTFYFYQVHGSNPKKVGMASLVDLLQDLLKDAPAVVTALTPAGGSGSSSTFALELSTGDMLAVTLQDGQRISGSNLIRKSGDGKKVLAVVGCRNGHASAALSYVLEQSSDATVTATYTGEKGRPVVVRLLEPYSGDTPSVDRGRLLAADCLEAVVNRHTGQPGVASSLFLAFEEGSLISAVLSAESHGGGTIAWVREEGLAELVSVALVDLGNNRDLEESDDSALYSEHVRRDVLEQFVNRLKHHASQLYSVANLAWSTKDLGQLLLPKLSGSGGDSDDDFGIRKVVVAVSATGKVFGLDSKSGRVFWQVRLSRDRLAKWSSTTAAAAAAPSTTTTTAQLFVQRTSHHNGVEPLCTLVLSAASAKSTTGLVTFNPLTGAVVNRKQVGAGPLKKAVLLHHPSRDNVRPLALVLENDEVVLEPESANLGTLSGKIYLASVVSDPDGGGDQVVGQRLLVEERRRSVRQNDGNGENEPGKPEQRLRLSTPLWSLSTQGARVVALAGKPTGEVVHSQGRVLADRSVLFKYINPNLGFVLAEGESDGSRNSLASGQQQQQPSRTFVNVYLVDLVTGRVIFAATHKRVGPPYHVVHSENWAVYSYYNEKSRRMEMSSLELFEGKEQRSSSNSNNNVSSSLSSSLLSSSSWSSQASSSSSGTFSSLKDRVSPLVERQSFILGPAAAGVSALVDTKTGKGITAKHILMAAAGTGAIYDVPRHLLDPRRPNPATPPEEREYGVPPYVPELQLGPSFILNYNRTVMGVRGMETAPTGLESTSVVFVYGLDLYSTRVTPSRGFDLLKEDFDYYVISLVLMALIVGAFVTRKLAQRKTLKQAWR